MPLTAVNDGGAFLNSMYAGSSHCGAKQSFRGSDVVNKTMKSRASGIFKPFYVSLSTYIYIVDILDFSHQNSFLVRCW